MRADYAARVLSLKPRFDLYEQANRANAHPWLVDLLVWSARRSPRRLQRMAGVLEETHIPTDAVTVRGVARAACSTGADGGAADEILCAPPRSPVEFRPACSTSSR